MTGLNLAPQFNGSIPAAYPMQEVAASAPMMDGVRSFVGGAGEIGGAFADAAMHPAARPWMGGLAGVMALVLAFTYGPGLLENFPLLGGDDFASRGMKGLASLGLAAVVGTGAFELVNNGFDLEKTGKALGKDASIAMEMVGNGSRFVDDKATDGRIGETVNLIGNNLVDMDNRTGNVVSGTASLAQKFSSAQLDLVWRSASAVGSGISYVATEAGEAYDALIGHGGNKLPPMP